MPAQVTPLLRALLNASLVTPFWHWQEQANAFELKCTLFLSNKEHPLEHVTQICPPYRGGGCSCIRVRPEVFAIQLCLQLSVFLSTQLKISYQKCSNTALGHPPPPKLTFFPLRFLPIPKVMYVFRSNHNELLTNVLLVKFHHTFTHIPFLFNHPRGHKRSPPGWHMVANL